MLFRRFALAAGLAVAAMFASVPAQEQPRVSPSLFAETEVAQHRPAPRQPDGGRRRAPAPAVHVLHGGGERRRLEDDRRGAHVGADLRRSAHRLDRLDRGRAVGSRTSSTPAAARACTGPTSRRATASTSPRTPGGRGRGSASTTRSRFRASTSIRAIPNRLFVAALGHPYGPNEERGIFRSTDGGSTFQKVLYKDENTGGNDVDIDPVNPERRLRHAVGGAAGPVGERGVGGHGRRHLQVHRRRHDVEAADQRAAAGRAGEPGHLAGRPPKRLYATVAFAERARERARTAATTGIFRSDDAGETWTRITTDSRPSGRIGGGDLPMPTPRSEEPRPGHHGEHRVVEVDRRRQDVGAVQGRAGRRGLPERLDQPGQPRHHAARRRPGRRRDAQRRQDVEFLVQPADRAALSRGGRQRVPLPRVQRAAGERVGLRLEPRQLRRDLGSRLAAGRRGRVRLRRARSARTRTSSTAAAA